MHGGNQTWNQRSYHRSLLPKSSLSIFFFGGGGRFSFFLFLDNYSYMLFRWPSGVILAPRPPPCRAIYAILASNVQLRIPLTGVLVEFFLVSLPFLFVLAHFAVRPDRVAASAKIHHS
ncbi:hypothetical protein GGS23DRAFT_452166 [Durotheca rogersii]|uniref:uncharacterized protein n=1 Tax=Durotheca rogersii TaxID=419775 RepID=UPI00221FBF58|nr:uncharacterized protein GGS23DRAFT_452166 [Durotheca rogersii]KAI5864539.1 hypothetical protein GGS23DRAFT_452166 [Durotheca rogersii]